MQTPSWVADRNEKHFASARLYLHGFTTGLLAWIMIGWAYWQVALIILITHTLIDGWKSYQKSAVVYFLTDQFLHVLVITGCWYFTFLKWSDVQIAWLQLNSQTEIWKTLTAFIFVSTPAGILIGQCTKQWRDKIADAESLANPKPKQNIWLQAR